MHQILKEHIEVISALEKESDKISSCIDLLYDCAKKGGKILLCGNGGSAADAQHIAAELSGKFLKHRDPIDAEALHVNSSYITAVANDLNFNEVYSRALKAKGKPGDVLIALSTSGNSQNVIKAVQMANDLDIHSIALTGRKTSPLSEAAKMSIHVQSDSTPRIQEAHILIGHIICQQVEERLFPDDSL